MSLTVENKTVTVGRGYGVISFLAAKTEQKQRKGKAYDQSPIQFSQLTFFTYISTFFPAEQSIGNSVTMANCFPNCHLLSSQICLMLGFKKKKKSQDEKSIVSWFQIT